MQFLTLLIHLNMMFHNAEGRLAVARAHLAAAFGSGSSMGGNKPAAPSEKMQKLLKQLEKYDHE